MLTSKRYRRQQSLLRHGEAQVAGGRGHDDAEAEQIQRHGVADHAAGCQEQVAVGAVAWKKKTCFKSGVH